MTDARAERRLAAILAGDIVGYSRLMGADEEGTLARVNAVRREFWEPKIAEHRGRIVKRTGDGVLIEFASVVDAARYGVEIQRGMAKRNAEVPEDTRIELRMGIHIGDILIEDDDIFGDGVNVAARLEGIAEPGGICFSRAAFEQVEGKLDVSFEDGGDQQLKNIARPIRVYRTNFTSTTRSAALALPDKPSIAVLPFQNMSDDPDQEYFADGIVEDIITGLSRIKWLFVIARNSTFAYKGRAVDVKQIGRELGVRYVLEGSVRKTADRVRITGQLIDSATGTHLWAERYDRKSDDILKQHATEVGTGHLNQSQLLEARTEHGRDVHPAARRGGRDQPAGRRHRHHQHHAGHRHRADPRDRHPQGARRASDRRCSASSCSRPPCSACSAACSGSRPRWSAAGSRSPASTPVLVPVSVALALACPSRSDCSSAAIPPAAPPAAPDRRAAL